MTKKNIWLSVTTIILMTSFFIGCFDEGVNTNGSVTNLILESTVVELYNYTSNFIEDEGEIIVISERVGEEIDPEEREKFKLFQNVKGFQSAVFIKLSDNRYFLKITYLDDKTGELKIARTQHLEMSTKNTGDYIDHFEEIQTEKHQYQNLSTPQTVRSDSGETQTRKIDADSSKKKTICLSIGLGFPVYEGGPQPSLGAPVAAFSLRLFDFPIAYMFSAGGGLSRHKERVTGLQHEYSYDIHSILYMIPLSKSKKTIFFLGGGIGSIKIKIENPHDVGYTHQKYTLYNFEVGCNPWLRGFLGYHTKVRYLYSKWSNSCIQFILGIDFNFHFHI